MTKAELLKLLEPYGDDQYVFVLLHGRCSEPFIADQICIQSVKAIPPWYGSRKDKSKYLVGIVCHVQNAEVKQEDD